MIPFKGQVSDELFGVDLSHLSSEEKAAILQVAARAKQLEYAAAADSIPPPENLTESQSNTPQAGGSYEDVEELPPDKEHQIIQDKGEEEDREDHDKFGREEKVFENEIEMQDMSSSALHCITTTDEANQIMSQTGSKSVENVREIDRSTPQFSLRRSTSDLIVQASQDRNKEDVSFARRKTFPAVISYLFRKGANDEDVDEAEQKTTTAASSYEKASSVFQQQRSANAQKLRFMTSNRGNNEMSLSEALVRKLTLDKSVQLELRKQMVEEDKKSEPQPLPDVTSQVETTEVDEEVAAEAVAEVESTQIPKVVVTSTDGATIPVEETTQHEVINWAIPYLHEPVDGVEERDNDYFDSDSSEYSESSDSPIVSDERSFVMNQNFRSSEISHNNFGNTAACVNDFELSMKEHVVEVDAEKEEPEHTDEIDDMKLTEVAGEKRGNDDSATTAEKTELNPTPTQQDVPDAVSSAVVTPMEEEPLHPIESQQPKPKDQFESFQPESSAYKFASLKKTDSYKLDSANHSEDDDVASSNDDVSKSVDNDSEPEEVNSPPLDVRVEETRNSVTNGMMMLRSKLDRDDDSSCIYAFHGSSYYDDDDDDGSDFTDDDDDEKERLMLEGATSSIPVYPEDMEDSSWCEQESDPQDQLRRGSGLFFRRTLSTSNFDDLLNSKTTSSRTTVARASLPKLVTGNKVTINFRSLPESTNAPKRSGSLTAPVLTRKTQSLETAAAADAQAATERENPKPATPTNQPPPLPPPQPQQRRIVLSASKQNLSTQLQSSTNTDQQQTIHDDRLMMTSPHLDLMADARPRRQNAVVTSPSSSSQRSSLGDSPTPSSAGKDDDVGGGGGGKCGSNLSDIIDLCQLNALIDALKGARDLLAGTEAKQEVQTTVATTTAEVASKQTEERSASTTTTQTTLRKIDTCVQTSFESTTTTTMNQQQQQQSKLQECPQNNNSQQQQKYNNNDTSSPCQCACGNKCNNHQQPQPQQFNNRNDRCITWLPQFYPYPSPPPPPPAHHLYHDCNRISGMMTSPHANNIRSSCSAGFMAPSPQLKGCNEPGCTRCLYSSQLPPSPNYQQQQLPVPAIRRSLATTTGFDPQLDELISAETKKLEMTQSLSDAAGKAGGKLTPKISSLVSAPSSSPGLSSEMDSSPANSEMPTTSHTSSLSMQCLHDTQLAMRRSISTPTVYGVDSSSASQATQPNYDRQLQLQELQEINKQKRQKITKEIIDNQHQQLQTETARLQLDQQQNWLEQQQHYLNEDYSKYTKEISSDKSPTLQDYPTSSVVTSSILPITRSYTASVDQQNTKWYNQPNTMPRRSSVTSGDSVYSKFTSVADTSMSMGRSKSRRRLPPPPPSLPQDEDSVYESSTTAYSSWSSNHDLSSVLDTKLSSTKSDVSSRLRQTLEDLDQEERELNMKLRYLELGRRGWNSALIKSEVAKEEKQQQQPIVTMEAKRSSRSAVGCEIRGHDSDYHRGSGELRHGRASGSVVGGYSPSSAGGGEEFYRSSRNYVVVDDVSDILQASGSNLIAKSTSGGSRSHQQQQQQPYSNDDTPEHQRKNGANYDHVASSGRSSRHRTPNKSRLARRVTTSGFEDVFDVTSSIASGGGGYSSSSKSVSGGYRKEKSGGSEKGEERSGGRSKRRHQSSDYENIYDDRGGGRYSHHQQMAPPSGCEYQDHQPQEASKRRSSRSSSASNRSYSRQTPRRHRSTSADVGNMETDWRDQEYYSKNDDYYQQLYLYCKPNEYENTGEQIITNEGAVVRATGDWNELGYEDSTYAEFSHKPRD